MPFEVCGDYYLGGSEKKHYIFSCVVLQTLVFAMPRILKHLWSAAHNQRLLTISAGNKKLKT